MKITKRQLRKIIRENRSNPMLVSTDRAIERIEEILNDLYDQGLENRHLIEILEQVIKDINRGFVGEPR